MLYIDRTFAKIATTQEADAKNIQILGHEMQ